MSVCVLIQQHIFLVYVHIFGMLLKEDYIASSCELLYRIEHFPEVQYLVVNSDRKEIVSDRDLHYSITECKVSVFNIDIKTNVYYGCLVSQKFVTVCENCSNRANSLKVIRRL